MKCPNCGAEIPAGSLYCAQCGEDIHIVPDFDPEMELNLEETIQRIAEGFTEGEEEDEAIPARRRGHGRRVLISFAVFVLLLLTAGTVIAWRFHQYNSVAYQVEKAVQSVEEQRYESAVEYYKRALELDSDNIDIMFALSDVYFRKNNKIEYEHILREIASNGNATAEQLESAYGKLIAIYRARKDYKTINELLSGSGNEAILNKFQNYIAEPPEFSVEEGYYSSIQPLKLSALTAGNIYYTMDGTEPDETSDLYTAPILLDDGDYVITACFVNEYGIVSDSVSKSYHVMIEELPIPELATISGNYSRPTDIEILDDEEDIYYTTDGSTPTTASRQYTGPIPMPIGRTEFRFIRIADGRSSPVAIRTYDLTLATEVSVQDAEQTVTEYMIRTGKICDVEGHVSPDAAELYKYQYQYVKTINGLDDFYVIAEVYWGTDGSRNRTGSYFAVNVYQNVPYRLQINGNSYTLIEME